jgi:hypothetical protein
VLDAHRRGAGSPRPRFDEEIDPLLAPAELDEPFAASFARARPIRRPQSNDRGARAVDLLRSSEKNWHRHQALVTLLRTSPRPDLAYLPVVFEAIGEPDPELRCWRVAALIAELTAGWLPAALEGYRSRERMRRPSRPSPSCDGASPPSMSFRGYAGPAA